MRCLGLTLLVLVLSVAAQEAEVRLVRVAEGLTFPVDIQSAKDGSKRLFIAQQNGVVRVMRDGALVIAPFLDIRSKTRVDSECGLLGLAFPPGYREKRHFYVNYTNPACTSSVIARYRVTGANADVAEAGSEEILLTQAQPFTNHNGGQLQFGPDGFLYIGFGDGGSGGDPRNNAQNTQTWLGKLLRIDTEGGGLYRVPAANPFAADARYKPEIWAMGVRNPWRFSFDRVTGDMWIGDVGQDRAEEINFQPAGSTGGENYGWRVTEGLACYNPANGCDGTGLTQPVHEYTRGQGDVSVTGGYVYRGSRWTSLRGTYVYGDYATGRIWGLRREGALFNNRLLARPPGLNVSTFGEGEDGEIYVAHYGGGVVYRMEAVNRPVFTARSVVNAASFDPGLTPGSAASLFASGMTSGPGVVQSMSLPLQKELGGVRVLVNGAEMPLYAVANVSQQEQVNFQVPFDLARPAARVAVSFNGVSSAEVEVPVLEFQPGVFTGADQQVIAVDALSNTLAPVLRGGSFVYFYATGLGAVENAPAAGAASPRRPLARVRVMPVVTLGGVVCEVQFAGLAPDFAGIYQVNIRVPGGAAPGLRDLVVTTSGVASRPVPVTVQ